MSCCRWNTASAAAAAAARGCRPLVLRPLRWRPAGRRCAAAAVRCMGLRPAAKARGRAHVATRSLLLLGLWPLLVLLLPLRVLPLPAR